MKMSLYMAVKNHVADWCRLYLKSRFLLPPTHNVHVFSVMLFGLLFGNKKQLDPTENITVNSLLAQEHLNALPASSIPGVVNVLLVTVPSGIV